MEIHRSTTGFKVWSLVLVFALLLMTGCGTANYDPTPTPTPPSPSSALSAGNINLIFAVTPDVANDPLGDINTSTGNLSNQGLQRSLMMATYLKQQLPHSAGVDLSNETILLAWEHKHFPLLMQHLINSYGGTAPAPTLTWPDEDYDTIWTVKIDNTGNLTVDNALCEGIDSTKLLAIAPQF